MAGALGLRGAPLERAGAAGAAVFPSCTAEAARLETCYVALVCTKRYVPVMHIINGPPVNTRRVRHDLDPS